VRRGKVLKKKIYPSSMTFSWDGACLAEYNSQCWRYQQLAYGVSASINPFYSELGDLHEERHEKTLTVPYEREKPFKQDFPEYVVSGRADFVMEGSVDECKASVSSSIKLGVIRDGNVKTSHLAQLTLYLMQFGYDNGRLVYGYYQHDREENLVCTSERLFDVTLDNKAILVDGEPSLYTVNDLVSNIVHLGEWLITDELAPRPVPLNFGGPCKYCPLAGLCDKAEQIGATVSVLKEEAKSLIENQPQKEVKITKQRRKKK
jgi:CRISPR/Cas system-associated exonuclease Cas4 (RecB family)